MSGADKTQIHLKPSGGTRKRTSEASSHQRLHALLAVADAATQVEAMATPSAISEHATTAALEPMPAVRAPQQRRPRQTSAPAIHGLPGSSGAAHSPWSTSPDLANPRLANLAFRSKCTPRSSIANTLERSSGLSYLPTGRVTIGPGEGATQQSSGEARAVPSNAIAEIQPSRGSWLQGGTAARLDQPRGSWLQDQPSTGSWLQGDTAARLDQPRGSWLQDQPSRGSWLQDQPSRGSWLQDQPSTGSWLQGDTAARLDQPSGGSWLQGGTLARLDQPGRGNRLQGGTTARLDVTEVGGHEERAVGAYGKRWKNQAFLEALQSLTRPEQLHAMGKCLPRASTDLRTRSEVLDYLEQNKSVAEITKLTGIADTTIYKWKKRIREASEQRMRREAIL